MGATSEGGRKPDSMELKGTPRKRPLSQVVLRSSWRDVGLAMCRRGQPELVVEQRPHGYRALHQHPLEETEVSSAQG